MATTILSIQLASHALAADLHEFASKGAAALTAACLAQTEATSAIPGEPMDGGGDNVKLGRANDRATDALWHAQEARTALTLAVCRAHHVEAAAAHRDCIVLLTPA